MRPTTLTTKTVDRLKKATMKGRLSGTAQLRIRNNYPHIGLLDRLRMWWVTRGIRA